MEIEFDLLKFSAAVVPVLLVLIGGIMKGKIDLEKTAHAVEVALPEAIESFDKDGNLEGATEVGVGLVRMVRKGAKDKRLNKKHERKSRMAIASALRTHRRMTNAGHKRSASASSEPILAPS